MGSGQSGAAGTAETYDRDSPGYDGGGTTPHPTQSRRRPPKYRAPVKTDDEDNIPDVRPPVKTKDLFLDDIDFRVIDEHACKAPNDLLVKSFWDLAKYLSDDNAWNDLVKVRSIFRWITSYDIKKIKIDKTPPPDTPLEYFNKIQCDMGNHAYLFFILCSLLEVPCVVVNGMAKNKAYKIGEPIEHEEIAAQWNAVYIQGEWRLLDAYWGITCVKVDTGRVEEYDDEGDLISTTEEYYVDDEEDEDFATTSYAKIVHREPVDEQYFLTDPRQLIWTHFPEEEKWQLLKNPISEHEWEGQLYMRERTHEMGVKVNKRKHGRTVIDAKDGKADIVLWLPEDRSDSYQFKYSFYRTEVTHERRPIDKILNRFTIFDHMKDRIHFKCMLPVSGRFKLSMYGRDTADPELEEFDLLCVYVIDSTMPDKEQMPLPDYPKIGWGPCMKTKKAGLFPITHKHADIVTEDGMLEIRLGGRKELKLQIRLKSHIIDDANISKYALLRWHAGEYIIDTRFKYPGVYAMLLYANMDPNSSESVNVLNYLITVTGRAMSTTPFPTITQGLLGEDPDAYKLGIRSFQPDNGFMEAREGHAKLVFDAKEGVHLLCELHSNNSEAAERMRVIPREEGSKQCFYLDLPIEGEYSFNVHAKKRSQPNKLYHAFAYLIQSTGRVIEKGQTNTTKGNTNRSFWRDCTEIHTETIETKDDDVCVPVPRGIDHLEVYVEKKESHDPPSSKTIEAVTEKGVDLYKVKVDNLGEYFINIYERKNLEFLKSKAKYVVRKIHVDEAEEKDFNEVMEIIRQERIRAGKDVTQADKLKKQIQEVKASKVGVNERIILTQRLKEAIESKNLHQLRRAMKEYEYIKPNKNDDLLQQALKLLKEIEFKEDLIRAYRDQDLQALDRVLRDASKRLAQDPITQQRVALAKRLRDRLAAQNNLRDMVLKTNINTITELRKLHTPPEPVKKTIQAAFIVMGHPQKEVENWKKCLALLGKRDPDSLRRRMADIEPNDVKREDACEARDIIEPYTADKLRYISPAAAAFYQWTAEVIREVEAMSGKLPQKKVAPPPKTKTPAPRAPSPPPPPVPSPKKKREPKTKYVTLDSLFPANEKNKQPPNVEETEKKMAENPSGKSPDGKESPTRSDSRSYTRRFQKKNDYMASKNRGRPKSDQPITQVKEADKNEKLDSQDPKKGNTNKGKENKEPSSPRKTNRPGAQNKDTTDKAGGQNKDPKNRGADGNAQKKDNGSGNDKNDNPKQNNNGADNSANNTGLNSPKAKPGFQKAGGNKDGLQSPRKPVKGKPPPVQETPYDNYLQGYKADLNSRQPDILEIKHDDDDDDEFIDPNGYTARFRKKRQYMQGNRRA